MNNYPSYFPKNCPPNDAVFQEIEVYRCCKQKDEITHLDFQSTYMEKERLRIQCKDMPEFYGVSLFSNREIAINKLPTLKKCKSIAKGITRVSCGPCKRTLTSDSHYTWWLFENSTPYIYFTIEEV